VAFEESLGPDILRDAPAVELRDGLVTVREVINAVPECFSGSSTSTCVTRPSWAERFGAGVRCRGRSSNRRLLDSDVPFRVYNLVTQELARRPEPYLDAQVRVREALLIFPTETAP
jgi:hypothetical protein